MLCATSTTYQRPLNPIKSPLVQKGQMAVDVTDDNGHQCTFHKDAGGEERWVERLWWCYGRSASHLFVLYSVLYAFRFRQLCSWT
jgi:hypothetical protein